MALKPVGNIIVEHLEIMISPTRLLWSDKFGSTFGKDITKEVEKKEDPVIVSTNGWDTVYVITIDYLNNDLKKKGPPIRSFSSGSSVLNISGDFDPWQVIGGSNEIIKLNLPIKSGQSLGIPGMSTSTSLGGFSVDIELHLDFINSVSQPNNPQAGYYKELKVAARPNPKNNREKISVTVINPPQGFSYDVVTLSILRGLFTAYLQNHSSEIGHIFATVNLANYLDSDGNDWVVPTLTSYSFQSNTLVPEQKGMLAILSLTKANEDRRASLTQEVSPYAIPTGSKAGFLISDELFLMKMIAPGIEEKYGLHNNFCFNRETSSIHNSSSFHLPDVHKSGKSYTPKVNNNDFSIGLQNGVITLNLKTHVDISPGITGYTTQLVRYKMLYENSSKSIKFEQDGQPQTDSWTHTETWVKILEGVGGALAAVLALFTGGVSEAIYGLAMGVLLGVIAAIPSFLELAVGNAASTQKMNFGVFKASMQPIQWSGVGDFNLNKAQLSNCFQIGGIPSEK